MFYQEMLRVLGNSKQLVSHFEYKATKGCYNTDISIRSYGPALFFRTVKKRQRDKKPIYERFYSNYIEFLQDPYIANPNLNSVSTGLTHRTRSMFVIDIDNPREDNSGICLNCISIDDIYEQFERQFGIRPNCHRESYKGNGNLQLYIILDEDKFYEKEKDRWYIDITQWLNTFSYTCPNGKVFTGDSAFKGWRCQKPDIAAFSGELYTFSSILDIYRKRNQKKESGEAIPFFSHSNDETDVTSIGSGETSGIRKELKNKTGRLMQANVHFLTRWRKYRIWNDEDIARAIHSWSEKQKFSKGSLDLTECAYLVKCLRRDDRKGLIKHNYTDEDRAKGQPKGRATQMARSVARGYEAKKLKENGMSYAEIACKIGLSRRQIIRLIRNIK